MKPDTMSVKWKIFFYILIFAIAMIVLLWLFQIVFLDDFYQAIKKSEIQKTAQTISQNIDNENVETLIDQIGDRFDMRVEIADMEGNTIYSTDTMLELPQSELAVVARKTQENGGSKMEIFRMEKLENPEYNEQMFNGNNVPPRDMNGFETLIYSQIVTPEDGTSILLVLTSRITPVDATVDTLRVQLVYITIILLGCALFLAFVISKWISRPIVKINKGAKKLARAEYDVCFDDGGYREIAELADTLNYASRELSKVEKLRRELLANISHDLRTPLTMIIGYSEVMRDIPGENTPENIQIIIDEAKRLTTLVNDAMDISKLQAGTQELNMERFNLTESISNIVVRYVKLVEQDGYSISFVCDRGVYVLGDEVKIGQVLCNLLSNAINYSEKDKRIFVRQETRDGQVTVSVEDHGEGIAEDQLEYIWDRYYKVDKTHKRASVGTGLGLSIVKGVLELHHAEYGVESEVGKGSTFWFRLPEAEDRQ
ncbi:sensor histidine kinase [Christensenella tenuis]|uniref:histidine kinase n=1 Tax=Christensenella tenuis TaxID=2763033 RepID=A0ABR7EC19_9FIRM|nr:HAMP domain-containing sensor histidine kinase [Christensenella tenuis]MBC5647281.1 two-component sensor histidine kinase [Christensenella tenuis]